MDTILLTGAGGYLGSRVAEVLSTSGRAWWPLQQRLEDIIPGSLDCSIAIHCAGALRNRPDRLHAVNAEGTSRLLCGLVPGARVIYVSTRSVYANAGHRLVDENEPTSPWDDYGRSKLAAETYIQESGRPAVIFRPCALFGHPRLSSTFPDHAFDQAIAGRVIRLATPDRQEDYLDVDTLAALLVAACAEGAHWGGVYNAVGPVRPLSSIVAALAGALTEQMGREPEIIPFVTPVPDYPLLDGRRCAAVFPNVVQPTDSAVFVRMLGRVSFR